MDFVYILNTSDDPQTFRHTALRGLRAVGCTPSGFVPVDHGKVVFPPHTALILPKPCLNIGGGVWRKSWSKKISLQEYEKLSIHETEVSASTICPHCGKDTTDPSLADLNMIQLRELAKEHGIKFPVGTSKAQAIDTLKDNHVDYPAAETDDQPVEE